MEKTRTLRDFHATQDVAGNLTLILRFTDGTAAGVRVPRDMRRTLAYLVNLERM